MPVLPPTQQARLQGARIAGPPPQPDHRRARTQRRVSAHGETNVISQRVPVGLRHAGRIVTIEIDERGDTLINQTPFTSTKLLARFKAYGANHNRTTKLGAVTHHLKPICPAVTVSMGRSSCTS